MKTLQGLGQGVMKSIQDARIGETIESGVNSVRAKLNDPAFQKDVKEKAQAGWSWLSSTAGSIWSAAKEAATQIASELNETNANGGGTPRPAVATPKAEAGDREEAREGARSPRTAGKSPRIAEKSPKIAVEESEEEVAIGRWDEGRRCENSRRKVETRNVESGNSDIEMDDDDWMEQELQKARQNLHIQEKQRTPQAPLSPAAGGLKLSHEGSEASGGAEGSRRRHHSHHHKHRKRGGGDGE